MIDKAFIVVKGGGGRLHLLTHSIPHYNTLFQSYVMFTLLPPSPHLSHRCPNVRRDKVEKLTCLFEENVTNYLRRIKRWNNLHSSSFSLLRLEKYFTNFKPLLLVESTYFHHIPYIYLIGSKHLLYIWGGWTHWVLCKVQWLLFTQFKPYTRSKSHKCFN